MITRKQANRKSLSAKAYDNPVRSLQCRNVHRLSKVYPMRNTLENKRVEYIDGEIPLVEVRWF